VGQRVKSIDRSRARIPGTKLEGWRAIAVCVLALYVLLFIVLNNHRLDLNFVFFKIRSHELLALIMILLIGFAAGFIVGGRRQRKGDGPAAPDDGGLGP
jgi:uncharacterized integral membrane protein